MTVNEGNVATTSLHWEVVIPADLRNAARATRLATSSGTKRPPSIRQTFPVKGTRYPYDFPSWKKIKLSGVRVGRQTGTAAFLLKRPQVYITPGAHKKNHGG